MSTIIFIALLVLVAVMLIIKYWESIAGKPSRLGVFFAKGDPLVKVKQQKFFEKTDKISHNLRAFLTRYIPHHSSSLYSRLKTIKDTEMKRLAKNFRGEQDLSHKGASSLFFWHISRDEDEKK